MSLITDPLPPLPQGSESAPNSLKQQPANPSLYVSLDDYQSAKNERLKDLKWRSSHHQQMWLELGFKNRQDQLRKGMKMSQGNPLAIDQSAEYEKNRARLMRKYVYKRR
jgi:hypothetical protein